MPSPPCHQHRHRDLWYQSFFLFPFSYFFFSVCCLAQRSSLAGGFDRRNTFAPSLIDNDECHGNSKNGFTVLEYCIFNQHPCNGIINHF